MTRGNVANRSRRSNASDEGNFKAPFESIEAGQLACGVLKPDAA